MARSDTESRRALGPANSITTGAPCSRSMRRIASPRPRRISSSPTSRTHTNGRTRPDSKTCTLRGGRSNAAPVTSASASWAGAATRVSMPAPPRAARVARRSRRAEPDCRIVEVNLAGKPMPAERSASRARARRASPRADTRRGIAHLRMQRVSWLCDPGRLCPRQRDLAMTRSGSRAKITWSTLPSQVGRERGSSARPARIFWVIVRGGSPAARARILATFSLALDLKHWPPTRRSGRAGSVGYRRARSLVPAPALPAFAQSRAGCKASLSAHFGGHNSPPPPKQPLITTA